MALCWNRLLFFLQLPASDISISLSFRSCPCVNDGRPGKVDGQVQMALTYMYTHLYLSTPPVAALQIHLYVLYNVI